MLPMKIVPIPGILILAAILIIVGFQTFLIGMLADMMSANRKVLEELLYMLKVIDEE